MTAPMDHRAIAEQLIAGINAQLAAMKADNALELLVESRRVRQSIQICVNLAQVHATLAAGTPVADQHLIEALTELRQAVRDYIEHVEDGDRFTRMAYLAAGGAR